MESAEEVWHLLTRYETRDLVDAAYRRRHRRAPTGRRIREVAANFVQGREFFRNAVAASISVRPLLQYYGVAALSRGLTLMLQGGKGAAELVPGHGLITKAWPSELTGGLAKLIDLEIEVTRGLFSDLITWTENKSYLRGQSSGVDLVSSSSVPPSGSRFSLRDIASTLPDVGGDYELATGSAFMSVPAQSWTNNREGGTWTIVTYARVEDAVIRAVLPPEGMEISTKGSNKSVKVPADAKVRIGQESRAFFGTIGQVHLVPAIRGSIELNDLSSYFAASFILGMLVRYEPATWVALTRQEKGDAAFPLVNRLIALIQDMYPRLVFEFLQGPYEFEQSLAAPKV